MCSIVVSPRRVVGNTYLIHEGARRTITAEWQRQLLFVHEGPLRAAENGNCRTATATSFCPRRAAKGHEERQLQNGNGNGNCRFFLSTKGREGARRTATAERQRQRQLQILFVHEGPRRGTKERQLQDGNGNFFLSTKGTKGHEERQLQDGNGNFFLSTKGREGARRTATAEWQRQLLFVHEGPLRAAENGNCRTATATSFCPRRAAKGHEERQLQDGNGNGSFFLSAKGREGARRTATAGRQRQRQLLFVHEGPRRGTKNGNCRTATVTSFCPRRAAKGRGERQLQNGNGSFFLSAKGREGARRTATAGRQRQLLFVHEGPRRGTKNGNCRTATATSFCPRRAAKGHEERQLQDGNGNFFLSTKGREGARRTATAGRQRQRQLQILFVHEGPRRGTKNGNCRTATVTSFCPRRARRGTKNGNCRTATATSFCPRRAAKGHEERQLQDGNGNFFCPRRAAKGHEERQLQNGNGNFFLSTKGREGARRTATAGRQRQRQLLFVREGPRRGTKNGNCRTATATAASFCPRRAAKGHEERQLQDGNGNFFLSAKGREGPRRTATAERQRQLLFVREGPRRGTKNGNCRTATATSFCPRRAAKGHEERQLQDGNGNFFLSTKGREGARRTATAGRQRQLLFVHEGPRRGTKNGNCRTATATSFCPRRAAKGHEERQLQDGNGNFFLSTKGRGEHSFVVAADHDCRTGDLGEEGAGSACRRHELA